MKNKGTVESKEANMWSLLRKNRKDCRQFRDSLEESTHVTVLPSTLREHAATCPDCGAIAEDVLASRELLRALPASQAATARPWFAPRVMAAIAARELELGHALEAWTAVPKLAARLTWACALALLLASTWLYESPRSTPKPGTGATVESLFDLPPASSTTQDDILVSRLEMGQ
jgi:hypothetical protein